MLFRVSFGILVGSGVRWKLVDLKEWCVVGSQVRGLLRGSLRGLTLTSFLSLASSEPMDL